MHFSRTIVFALPLLLSSSLALAETPSSSTEDATKKTDTTKKKDNKKQVKKATDTGTTGTTGTTHTTAGKKVENKDEDLDTSVGTTKTTSAEPQPARRDVAESRAEEVREIEGKRWSVAPLLGYGTADLKFGLGARGGYTFETPIYVGGTFLYHFGNSSVTSPTGTSVVEADRRFYYPAAEVGYDFGFGPLLVRPYGALGVLFIRSELTANGITSGTTTDKQLMIYPGITAQYILPRSPLFLGADMRVLLPLEGENASFSMFATAGITM
jgi:hypothetical protein